MKMLWQRASSQSPCGVRMLIECNHRNPRGLAPGSSQTPYFTECCIIDDYNDLTEEQQDFLDKLETGSVWAVSLKKPEDTVSARVAISFVGCGRDIRKEG